MKKFLMLINGLFTLSLIGCDYQDRAVFLTGSTSPVIGGESSDDHVLTNNNTFTENMNLFIKKYVVKESGAYDTLVDYKSLHVDSKQDKNVKSLRKNLYKQIADFKISRSNREEAISFYINTYNFLAIETVNSNFIQPSGDTLNSIGDILGKGSFLAFKNINYTVSGEQMSLDVLEKVKLKALLTNSDGSIDARFHFAVICAAKGCPVLLDEAFDPIKIDEQLDFITIKSLELPRNYELTENSTRLTQLFDWYQDDFRNHRTSAGIKAGSRENFLAEFLSNPVIRDKIEFVNYDWSLNIKQ